MSSKSIDSSTLNWVGQELENTLRQARQALEAYVEQPADTEPLKNCRAALHQVQGTLQMIEVTGGALLAEETEQVLLALLAADVVTPEVAHEVVMRAILQLPDYLQALRSGYPDIPQVLLPLVNELRRVRGAEALADDAFFAPETEAEPPAALWLEGSGDNEIRAIRHRYERGLLGWYRDQDRERQLATMETALADLFQGAGQVRVRRLWWVAAAAVRALRLGLVADETPLKPLLGQLDRAMRVLVTSGEDGIGDEQLGTLLRGLLYHLALVETDDAALQEAIQAFGLEDVLPDPEVMEGLRSSLSGCNLTAMTSVAEALAAELGSVKDQVDLFARKAQRPAAELGPVVESLRRVGDTLEVIGAGDLRAEVKAMLDLLEPLVASGGEADDEAMMDVAGHLLTLESRLQRFTGGPVGGSGEPVSPGGVSAAEVGHIRTQVAGESLATLGQVKEALLSFADSGDRDALAIATDRLHEIEGSLRVLNETEAADFALRLGASVRSLAQPDPEDVTLDAVADALTGIEVYLEHVRDGVVPPADLLRVAGAGVPEAAGSSDLPGTDGDTAGLTGEDDTPPLIEVVELEGSAMVDSSPLEGPADEIPSTEPEPPSKPADVAAFSSRYAVLAGEPDEEILDIFREEAAEELENIQNLLPHWLENSSHREALTEFRRSFHTLKGSGRLVGAERIGEFAWAIENLLNRLIDGTIEDTEILHRLLDRTLVVLPELVAQLSGSDRLSFDLDGMMALAHALAGGETLTPEMLAALEPAPAMAPPSGSTEPDEVDGGVEPLAMDAEAPQVAAGETAATEPTTPELAESADGAAEAPAIDPVLWEIFTGESRVHLAVLDTAFADCCRDADRCQLGEAVIRAAHTLHGSARMAGAEAVAEISGAMETYFKSVAEAGGWLPVGALADLQAAVQQISALVESPARGLAEAVEDMVARIEALPVVEPPAVDDPDTGVERTPVAEAVGDQATGSGEVPVTVGDSADTTETVVEDDDELRAVFLEEAGEILERLDTTLQQWIDAPDDLDSVNQLQRDLHTLKGGARMAELETVGDLAHAVESLLAAVCDQAVRPHPALFEAMLRVQDRLNQMVETLRAGGVPVADPELVDLVEGLRRGGVPDTAAEPTLPGVALDATRGSTPPDSGSSPPEDVLPAVAPAAPTGAQMAETGMPEAPAAEAVPLPQRSNETVRIAAALLDDLVNFAGEISIYRARLEQQVGGFRFNLGELDQTVERLRGQLRQLEMEAEAQVLYRYERDRQAGREDFDPLEMDRYSQLQQLARSMAETLNDLVSVEHMLEHVTSESDTLLVQQARVTTELQEGLMRTRMVPFAGLVPRLRRILRQVARELGKRVELVVDGGEGEMDRTVIERIRAPLEHMLRNAVAHGIESPAERRARGKPRKGRVHIQVERDGSEVVLRISDDGAGMDVAAIRNKAIERGLMAPDADLPDSEVLQFVLETGFSTAGRVDQIAGRGVGMDVVQSEVKQLGGSLTLASEAGQGTRITIRLPFTLAISHSLLVQVHEDQYAIPLTAVEGVVRMQRPALETLLAEHEGWLEYGGQDYRLRYLGEFLGLGTRQWQVDDSVRHIPILLVRSGDQRVALEVDQLLGSRETVVKSVGAQLSRVPGVSGATILGDGRVVLILDPAGLLRAGVGQHQRAEEVMAEPGSRRPLVMVVDDSITVRKVTTRLLERNEMDVITAKDGVDAVARLHEQLPDVMLLDIEMPRMDGFELATHVRNDPRLQRIPIVMITSRTGDKHRQRAREIGVDRYLGKPYQEHELLALIREMLEQRAVHA